LINHLSILVELNQINIFIIYKICNLYILLIYILDDTFGRSDLFI
jgi:hypothetical protein